eukprot:CAMPEP_0116017100 /NCGR_PEP_ID=MMETSP0321-20121206/7856_1 /TAXON_ID=163516 /ORGANISM="Leptocylindrus danicus var. danicus, Strain B650" /LENGTH=491 /DNA_ID=CAMNT_0003487247 /DNA_START=204 /DNA_END=1679 /DNA_ORIENTATION=+
MNSPSAASFRKNNEHKHRLKFEIFDSINDINAHDWDKCSRNVFTNHAWLRCLEDSKCASSARGWRPQHIAVYRQTDNDDMEGSNDNNRAVLGSDVPIAYVPMYLKSHSQGEFIFDNAFANAAHQAGIAYYPKLLIGVPFTPATGPRVLLHPDIASSSSENHDEATTIRKEIGTFLREVAIDRGISSVHFNFITDDEANDVGCDIETMMADVGAKYSVRSIFQDLQSTFFPSQQQQEQSDGFIRRSSIQYHWENQKQQAVKVTTGGIAIGPYESFEDYLACFKSKRRINIRRERRKIYEDEQIRVDVIQGKEILKYDGLVERMFEIYLSTIEKMYWGRQYLTVEFFQMLADSEFIDHLCFICARYRDCGEEFDADDVFAGTFNVVGDGVFYGRYWGCLEEVNNLHFEVCYWKAIEHCIDTGLAKMEPGAGGGDYKFARGFDAALVHSAHYFCHQGLRSAAWQYIEMEMKENVEMTEYLKAKSKVGDVKSKNT